MSQEQAKTIPIFRFDVSLSDDQELELQQLLKRQVKNIEKKIGGRKREQH